ncbi:helix-turn-helix domain-containing protein [Streptomyces sp. NPDC059008]|uniref:helix-turn-helix domain-containing protein n=1 Tax=Streptomyces sp. NPDC059008 TaxID=3346693 RepID=UPI00369D85CB
MPAPPLSTPAVGDESSELAPATVAAVRAGLVVGLVGVAGVAFVVSWTALHDVGRAIGLDAVGAVLYPLSADGPIGLALVASLVLAGRHRRAALGVLCLYTAASLVLNYVHGLVPLEGVRPRLSPVNWVHWALVGVAAALPVGSIACCADLVTRVLRSARPAVRPATEQSPTGPVDTVVPQVAPVDIPVDTPAPEPLPAPEPVLTPAPVPVPAPVLDGPQERPQRRLTVICGATELFRPEVPVARPAPEPEQPQSDDTRALVARLWWEGELSTRKAAAAAGVSKSTVDKAWQALAAEHGPRPLPGQSVPGPGQLEMAGVAA